MVCFEMVRNGRPSWLNCVINSITKCLSRIQNFAALKYHGVEENEFYTEFSHYLMQMYLRTHFPYNGNTRKAILWSGGLIFVTLAIQSVKFRFYFSGEIIHICRSSTRPKLCGYKVRTRWCETFQWIRKLLSYENHMRYRRIFGIWPKGMFDICFTP